MHCGRTAVQLSAVQVPLQGQHVDQNTDPWLALLCKQTCCHLDQLVAGCQDSTPVYKARRSKSDVLLSAADVASTQLTLHSMPNTLTSCCWEAAVVDRQCQLCSARLHLLQPPPGPQQSHEGRLDPPCGVYAAGQCMHGVRRCICMSVKSGVAWELLLIRC